MNTTKETEMSDTPRTDAIRYFNEVGDEVVPPSFARQLERENAELVEALRKVRQLYCDDQDFCADEFLVFGQIDALLAKLGEA